MVEAWWWLSSREKMSSFSPILSTFSLIKIHIKNFLLMKSFSVLSESVPVQEHLSHSDALHILMLINSNNPSSPPHPQLHPHPHLHPHLHSHSHCDIGDVDVDVDVVADLTTETDVTVDVVVDAKEVMENTPLLCFLRHLSVF